MKKVSFAISPYPGSSSLRYSVSGQQTDAGTGVEGTVLAFRTDCSRKQLQGCLQIMLTSRVLPTVCNLDSPPAPNLLQM